MAGMKYIQEKQQKFQNLLSCIELTFLKKRGMLVNFPTKNMYPTCLTQTLFCFPLKCNESIELGVKICWCDGEGKLLRWHLR